MTPPIELNPNLILPTRLRLLPSRTEQQAAVVALKQQPPRPKRQGRAAPGAKAAVQNTANTRRRRGHAALPSARHRDTDESPSPAHTPTSRRTRTPPTSLTDSEETDNSSSSAAILPHNLDSITRVANLPNTEYFQQPFQRLRIAPTASDISPPITQQTASQVAIPYTNQYPFQRLQLSPRPTLPSPSYAFTPLPSQISSTFWEPLHTPEHLPYMNIDTQTLQEDTTPQQLLLPQRRLSTTYYTTTCVA